MNFQKSWDELSKEEQWNYTEQLFSERKDKGLDPLSSHLLEPKDQWYCNHMKAKQNKEVKAWKAVADAQKKLKEVAVKKEAINADLEAAKARLAALKAKQRK